MTHVATPAPVVTAGYVLPVQPHFSKTSKQCKLFPGNQSWGMSSIV